MAKETVFFSHTGLCDELERAMKISDKLFECERLGALRTEEATDLLIAHLRDKSPLVRLSAARALFYGPKKAETPLANALRDQDYGVRINAAASLSSIITLSSSTFQYLVLALKDPCPEVRINAANALSRFIP